MTKQTVAARLAAQGLRLAAAEVAKLEGAIDDLDRISAWLATEPRSYLEEPVTVFHAGAAQR